MQETFTLALQLPRVSEDVELMKLQRLYGMTESLLGSLFRSMTMIDFSAIYLRCQLIQSLITH